MDGVFDDDEDDTGEGNETAQNTYVLGLVLDSRTEDRKSVELRGFEPLTFCMPCSTIPSDGVALGPVSANQAECAL